ncbi:hypothetical protein [Rhizobium ruizarguesonis]|uniref:hypothetical protein n=1 Tax=Rhizobium ruizarguesonis TaxID=2081791 RepID=UPI001CF35753|nr:hypothetical protein [Rhizobium ruizarguesonis]MCB2399353.1 hypothetical protein [Rhizobium ruizarguesonis]
MQSFRYTTGFNKSRKQATIKSLYSKIQAHEDWPILGYPLFDMESAFRGQFDDRIAVPSGFTGVCRSVGTAAGLRRYLSEISKMSSGRTSKKQCHKVDVLDIFHASWKT